MVFKSEDNLYTVEELVAQLIQKAREFAEDSTRKYTQPIIFFFVRAYIYPACMSALLDV